MPTTTPFNNLITFSRGSNATVTGSNGLIQWAPNNVLTFSEQFDNAAWTKSNITVTANNAAAPDGAVNADSISASGGSAQHFVSQSFSFTAGTAYTLSVFAKKNTLNGVQLTFGSGAFGTFPYANFDVNAGTTAAFNCTSTITDFGNGWYRCTMTATATATISAVSVIGLARDNAEARLAAFSSDGNGILIWGAQLELGSTATTYNPTTVKNLLGFSEAFDNAAWAKTNASIVTGAAANPINGLFNAQKLMENTVNNLHYIGLSAGTIGTPETFSFYAKAAGRNWAVSQLGSNANAYYDLVNGVLGTVTNGTASITAVGNGWYRCSLTATRPGNQNNLIYTASANGTASYTGDGNSGVYIYGAQLSDSASLDPYVPTPGAAPSSTAFYGPRFDFDPVTLQPRGLLVEEQRTNLFLRSEEFDVSATWIPVAASVTANATTSPSGAANADKLIEDATTGVHSIYQSYNQVLGTVYTMSFYAKAAERTWVRTRGAVGVNYFNLANGTIGTLAAGVTATITAVGNGWYRVTATYTSPSTSAANSQIAPTTADNVDSYAGTAGSGVFIYGAQLEAGAFATSYIPTVASTVTRNADSPSITGANFSGWFNAAAGAFVADFSVSGVDASSRRKVWNGIDSGNQRLALRSTDTAPAFPLGAVGTGTSVVSLNGAPMTANIPAKVALAYGANSALSQNGLTTATDANVNSVAPTSFGIGWDQIAIGQYLNGHIRSIRFIPARAADFQLQALST